MSLLFCFSAFLQAQTDGTLTFTFTHSKPSSYSEDFLAVWVEHNNGTFVKAKMRYVEQEPDHLPLFAVRAGGTAGNCFDSKIDVSDATTGATLSSSTTPAAWGTYTVVWDGKDLAGTTVIDGDYKMFVESAWKEGPSNTSDHTANFTFSKSSTASSFAPADGTYIKSVSINWAPASLGLDDNTLDNNNILIYPNPSNGIFNINFKNVTVNKIEAVDFLGRVVYSENVNTTKINSPKIMNLSHNAKGLYILKFYSDKGSWSHKIVIGN